MKRRKGHISISKHKNDQQQIATIKKDQDDDEERNIFKMFPTPSNLAFIHSFICSFFKLLSTYNHYYYYYNLDHMNEKNNSFWVPEN
ncbi:hypothetical protein DERF_011904 [Dermatophagoides farinae]|uniref:Uncharacterized protein n=1 Tax=Dermatophagoides farinae TaxID=6954 RepID=A0A922L2Z7_DERFA|nr:hypothetical protein DERF_011904 [Dermatophagoides farinae]